MSYRYQEIDGRPTLSPWLAWPMTALATWMTLVFLFRGGYFASVPMLIACVFFFPPLWARRDMQGEPRGLRAIAGAIFLVSGFILAPPTAYEVCAKKGVAYFQQIGSYPTLDDGRNAGDEAYKRCNRSEIAFDGLEDVS